METPKFWINNKDFEFEFINDRKNNPIHDRISSFLEGLEGKKEEILKAFIAKHGFEPDECEVLIQGCSWSVRKKTNELLSKVSELETKGDKQYHIDTFNPHEEEGFHWIRQILRKFDKCQSGRYMQLLTKELLLKRKGLRISYADEDFEMITAESEICFECICKVLDVKVNRKCYKCHKIRPHDEFYLIDLHDGGTCYSCNTKRDKEYIQEFSRKIKQLEAQVNEAKSIVKDFLEHCDYGGWNNLQEKTFRPKLESILKDEDDEKNRRL